MDFSLRCPSELCVLCGPASQCETGPCKKKKNDSLASVRNHSHVSDAFTLLLRFMFLPVFANVMSSSLDPGNLSSGKTTNERQLSSNEFQSVEDVKDAGIWHFCVIFNAGQFKLCGFHLISPRTGCLVNTVTHFLTGCSCISAIYLFHLKPLFWRSAQDRTQVRHRLSSPHWNGAWIIGKNILWSVFRRTSTEKSLHWSGLLRTIPLLTMCHYGCRVKKRSSSGSSG